jgi:hypothetical protein
VAHEESSPKTGSFTIQNSKWLYVFWLYHRLAGPHWAHWVIIMTSQGQKMSKWDTACKRKHITLTIPQKFEFEKWQKPKRFWLHTVLHCQLSVI